MTDKTKPPKELKEVFHEVGRVLYRELWENKEIERYFLEKIEITLNGNKIEALSLYDTLLVVESVPSYVKSGFGYISDKIGGVPCSKEGIKYVRETLRLTLSSFSTRTDEMTPEQLMAEALGKFTPRVFDNISAMKNHSFSEDSPAKVREKIIIALKDGTLKAVYIDSEFKEIDHSFWYPDIGCFSIKYGTVNIDGRTHKCYIKEKDYDNFLKKLEKSNKEPFLANELTTGYIYEPTHLKLINDSLVGILVELCRYYSENTTVDVKLADLADLACDIIEKHMELLKDIPIKKRRLPLKK